MAICSGCLQKRCKCKELAEMTDFINRLNTQAKEKKKYEDTKNDNSLNNTDLGGGFGKTHDIT